MNKTVGRFSVRVRADSTNPVFVDLDIESAGADRGAKVMLSAEDVDDLVYIATAARKECNLDNARRIRRGRL